MASKEDREWEYREDQARERNEDPTPDREDFDTEEEWAEAVDVYEAERERQEAWGYYHSSR